MTLERKGGNKLRAYPPPSRSIVCLLWLTKCLVPALKGSASHLGGRFQRDSFLLFLIDPPVIKRQINRRKKHNFNYVHMGAPQSYETQKAARLFRLIYHPELKKGKGSGASKGGKAIHRKLTRGNVW